MFAPITGPKVAALFVLGFGTIVAVNVTLAVNAVRTFPGTEVANSYVASQHFDADRAAQSALGWRVAAEARDGTLTLAFHRDGRAVHPQSVTAVAGRRTTEAQDITLALARRGDRYEAPLAATGALRLDIEARAADGTPFRRRLTLRAAP